MNDPLHIKKEYRGSHAYRIDNNQNPKERIFLKTWQEQNGIKMLMNILAKDREEYTVPSKRDIFVVNSIIQWLGTSVGQGFLHEVESSSCKKCRGFDNYTPCQECHGSGLDDYNPPIWGLKL